MSFEPLKPLRVTVVHARGLPAWWFYGHPDPYAFILVDEHSTFETNPVSRTSNPNWNQSFDVNVKKSSVIAFSVFDRRKSRKNDRGFIGAISMRVGDAIDLESNNPTSHTLDIKNPEKDTPCGMLRVDFSVDISLPPGWEHRTAPDGRSYYLDHNSGRATWDRPLTNHATNDSTA